MGDHNSTTDLRSESQIIADARMLQAEHGRGTLGEVVRRLRSALARLAGEPVALDGRRLTVH